MATLSVFKFGTPEGAQKALTSLEQMQKMQLIQVQDGAIVTWPKGAKKPKTQQMHSMTGSLALGGAFWGMLFGLLFFVPFFGLVVGAAMGALAGKFSDYGIDDKFINQVKSQVTEGTSALFVLSANAVADKVVAEMKGWDKFEIISTSLSAEQEKQLRDAFGDEAAPAEAAPAAAAPAAEPEKKA